MSWPFYFEIKMKRVIRLKDLSHNSNVKWTKQKKCSCCSRSSPFSAYSNFQCHESHSQMIVAFCPYWLRSRYKTCSWDQIWKFCLCIWSEIHASHITTLNWKLITFVLLEKGQPKPPLFNDIYCIVDILHSVFLIKLIEMNPLVCQCFIVPI